MNRKAELVVILWLFIGMLLYGADFPEMVNLLESSYDVQTAMLEIEQLRSEVSLLAHRGDIQFSLDPSVKVLTQEGGNIGGEVSLSGAFSAKIPVALSSPEKEKLAFSLIDLKRKEEELTLVRNQAFINLFSLYQDIWLLQREGNVLEKELEADDLALKYDSEKYALGTITLKSLDDTRGDYEEKKTELQKNNLEQRLSWYKLTTLIELKGDPVLLDRISLKTGDLPQPPELYEWLKANHPLLIAERDRIDQLERTLKRLDKADFDVSVKAFFNSLNNTVTGSLTYDFMDPTLTPVVGFPVYTFGEIPSSSGGGTATWNMGLTLNLGLGSGGTDRLTSEGLKLELKKSRMRLDYLTESVNLSLRSAYQQYLNSLSLFNDAVRNRDISENNKKTVTARKELNQTSELDVRTADAVLDRSLWKMEAARVSMEKSWLNLLNSALKLNIDSVKIVEGGNE